MKVRHPVFGIGEVLRERWMGMEYLVRFEDRNLVLWIKSEEVTLLDGTPPPPTTTAPRLLQSRPSRGGDFQARRMIEAFRLGIVPRFAIREFTFGRDSELRVFHTLLQEYHQTHGQVLLLEGPYGSGKTHFLDYLREQFLENGFAVSMIELHPMAGTPTRPKHIYREICRNFQVRLPNGKNGTFRDFLGESIESTQLPKPHPFLSPLFRALRKNPDDPYLWAYIQGEPLDRDYLDHLHHWRLPVLLDHSSAADIYVNLLTAYGFLLQQLGHPGLALLFDEGEGVFFTYVTHYDRWIMALMFLKGLLATALNAPETQTLDLTGETFYPVGKRDAWGRVHSGVRPMPYAYHLPSHLFVVAAFTPLMQETYLSMLQEIPSKHWLTLQPLSSQAYEEMFDATVRVYQRAFPDFVPSKEEMAKVRNRLLRNLSAIDPRTFLENLVHQLDLLRHYGQVLV